MIERKLPAHADDALEFEMEVNEAQAKRVVDPKYLDPVVESLQDVFDTLFDSKAEIKKRGLADSGKRPNNILALIAFSGAMRGTIGLSFPKETAKSVVNNMLMTDDIEACFRAVLEALQKCDLPTAEVIAWCAEMLQSDRVGFLCDQELRALRQQFEASRSP